MSEIGVVVAFFVNKGEGDLFYRDVPDWIPKRVDVNGQPYELVNQSGKYPVYVPADDGPTTGFAQYTQEQWGAREKEWERERGGMLSQFNETIVERDRLRKELAELVQVELRLRKRLLAVREASKGYSTKGDE